MYDVKDVSGQLIFFTTITDINYMKSWPKS